MNYKNLITEQNNGILIVKINRPEQLNALNRETLNEISNLFDKLRNDNAVKVIIITGAGEKAFVAGADIKEFYKFSVTEGKNLSKEGHKKVFDKIENFNKPVIAAINGYALGGGLELAMACHIRIASENAKMGLPELSLGLIPGYGGTQRLAQIVGKSKAFEMILSAEMISAYEAKEYKLVNMVCKQNELLQKAISIAKKILNNSPSAIEKAITAINAGFNKSGFNTEIELFGECFKTNDFKEGTTAFIEKRKANFKGN